MGPVRAKSTLEKYAAFLDLFHPEVKRVIQRLKQTKDRISRHKGVCLI